MKKNKILIISCLMMGIFTGCSNQTQGSQTTNTSETTITTTKQTIIEQTSEIVKETSEILEETTLINNELPVESEEIITTVDDSSTENEISSDNEEKTKIKNCIEKTINSSEHAMMQEVDDAMILSEFFLIDVNDQNLEEVVVYQCPMSATMSEIIVIKSSDIEYAKTILENRKQKAIDTDAWYPADVENAQSSIVGSVGNYAYFIINSNAAADETVLTNELLA